MSCLKCADMQKQLDIRNENTKVWIQSDTQCRKYACSLERELEELKDKYADLERQHNANLRTWQVKETWFITHLEKDSLALLEKAKQTYVDSPFWVSDDDGASWSKVPCTGKNKLEAFQTLIDCLSKHKLIRSNLHPDPIKSVEEIRDVMSFLRDI